MPPRLMLFMTSQLTNCKLFNACQLRSLRKWFCVKVLLGFVFLRAAHLYKVYYEFSYFNSVKSKFYCSDLQRRWRRRRRHQHQQRQQRGWPCWRQQRRTWWRPSTMAIPATTATSATTTTTTTATAAITTVTDQWQIGFVVENKEKLKSTQN